MSLGDLPDLGRIGKRIGKRLRDILYPPVDNGPSKEERLAQRLQDGLKGLVYFDSFDEVEDWRLQDVDPVQQANTPLLERSASQIYDQNGPTSRVLLCHDYSGGYHDWESVRPFHIQEKPYSCKYFQFVEYFIYFSHKLVCIPPASWINSCHRNGVKILGTFIVEGDGKAHRIERMLDQVDGEYVVARQLAHMARAYGFDGWLLNIEAEFPYTVQHPISSLTAFIRSLKRHLNDDCTVIWYDAITKDNEVDYQDALTWKNVTFGLAADLFFTNYKWTEPNLHKSTAVAEHHGIKPEEVYFGIDCWAQNTNMPGPPRVTYPPKGGGGTLTGLATNVLAHNGFSTAIFGPGWPYEHFSRSKTVNASSQMEHTVSKIIGQSDSKIAQRESIGSEAEAVERSMWEGTRLPDHLSCSCRQGHPHHRSGYENWPITRAAREYPAGSSSYLETNFQPAFHPTSARDEKISRKRNANLQAYDPTLQSTQTSPWISKLGYQAISPHVSHKQPDASNPTLHGEIMCEGSPCLRISMIPPSNSVLSPADKDFPEQRPIARFCLFKLSLAAEIRSVARVHFQFCSMTLPHLTAGFYTKAITTDSKEEIDTEYELFSGKTPESHDAIFNLNPTRPNTRIVEIGVYCRSRYSGLIPRDLLDLYRLVIKPAISAPDHYLIDDLEIYHRSSGNASERRLRWTWSGSKEGWPTGLPWSDLTGPFSSFSIFAGKKELGQACCLEFPLRSDDFSKPDGSDRNLVVKGCLFGGGEVFSAPRDILAGV